MKTDADQITENFPAKMTVEDAMNDSDVDCDLSDGELADCMD